MTSTPACLLLPLDLEPASLRAVGPALRLARRLDAPLQVVSWTFSKASALDVRSRLEDVLAELGWAHPVRVLVTRDHAPGPAISREASQLDATIVMASHARSGLTRAVLGSTAEAVLATADRPVVLVGPAVGAWAPSGNVIAAVDGSTTAEAILGPATALAGALDLPLELVEVIEADVTMPDDVLDGAYVVRLSRDLAQDVPRFDILHGDPATAIVEHATHHDLIALTTRLRTGVPRTTLGSVAMRVVHDAPCPVVVGTAVHAQDAVAEHLEHTA